MQNLSNKILKNLFERFCIEYKKSSKIEIMKFVHVLYYFICVYILISCRLLAGSKEDTIPSPKDAA